MGTYEWGEFEGLFNSATDNTLFSILNHGPVDHDAIVLWFLSQCPSAIVAGDDGWYVDIYARDPAGLNVYNDKIDTAIGRLGDNLWFMEHRGELEWDDDLDMCLKIPSGAGLT